MRKKALSYVDDWLLCLSAAAAVFLGLNAGHGLLSGEDLELWVGAIGFLLLGAVLAWRIRIIRRINLHRATVTGQVTAVHKSTWPGNEATVYQLKYTYANNKVVTCIGWNNWRHGPPPQVGCMVPLVIDPVKPTRCYVHAECLPNRRRRTRRR